MNERKKKKKEKAKNLFHGKADQVKENNYRNICIKYFDYF